ncbi:MAG: cadherin domain-containing protein, partial [Verrucomicrobia bacterium]|nr:cadherin domain-containing protein [Verrucomicrobiota bacterium]
MMRQIHHLLLSGLTLLSAALMLLVLVVPQESTAALPGKPEQLTSPDQVPQGLAKSDWSSIRAAYEAGRHAFQPTASGWQARNPGQQWTTQFDQRGFLAQPKAGGWTWGLELQSYGFGEKQTAVGGTPAVKAEGQRLSYQWDATVQEWFVNDQRGLEHGFTISQRPEADPTLKSSDSTLNFVIATRGSLSPLVAADAQGVSFQDKSGATVLNYAGLKVWDADGKTLASRFEAAGEGRVRLRVEEGEARYPITIDPIAQQAYLKPSAVGTTQAGDYFGWSVAVSGDTVVVGAYNEDSSTTGVNSTPNESASNAGAVYVFVRSGATWSQQAYLKASQVTTGDQFGYSVAVSGDTLVVGANLEDSSTTGINSTPNESASAAGAVYVFLRSGTTWSQQAYLKASQVTGDDQFGNSVAVSGDTVVVGAVGEDSSTTGVNSTPNESATAAGAAYVFARSGTTWSQQAYLKAGQVNINDNCGISVAVSEDTVVVGVYADDSSTTGVNSTPNESSLDSGAAYVFVRSGTTWSQQAYLKASQVTASDTFGVSVAVSSNTVVVGANLEDSSTTGINSTPIESAADAGASYIFTGFTDPPTVSNISPATGPTLGGTSVTITGTNFTGVTGVTIGGTAATAVTVVNATTITATTPAGSSGTASVEVTTPGGTNASNTLYTYTNQAPVITSNAGGASAAISVAESVTAVTTVTATDADAGQTKTYSISGGADSARFSINSSTGVLTFRSVPDYENPADGDLNNVYDLIVTVTDNGTGNLSDSQTLTVTVTNVNESNALLAIDNTGANDPVNINTGRTWNFRISAGAGGVVKIDRALFGLNKGNNAVADITFKIYSGLGGDQAGNTVLRQATLTSLQVDNFFTTQEVFAFEELTLTPGDYSATLTTTAASGNTAYALKNGKISLYDASGYVDANSTVLSSFYWVQDSNDTGTAGTSFVVNSSQATGSALQVAEISVYNGATTGDPALADGQPSALSYGSLAAGSTATRTYTIKNEGSVTLTLYGISFTGGSAGLFSVTTAPATLSLAAGASTTFTVSFSPVASGTAAAVMSISSSDPDEASFDLAVTGTGTTPPVITSNGGGASAAISVTENSTAVTTVVATDVDLPAQGITYSITGGADSAKFSIDPASGVLTFATAPDFEVPTDAGGNNVYDLIVTASDDGIPVGTKTQSIAVTVTNANEAPVITSNGGGATASVSIFENTTAVATVTSTDVDASSTKTFSISGGADAAKFSIVAATGVLTFTAAPNYEVPTDVDSDNVYEVTVRIVDNGSPALDDTQALSVTVADVNDVPSFALPPLARQIAGATWTDRGNSATWYSIASSADGTKLAAGAYNGLIYTSTDSGANWTSRSTSGSRKWLGMTSSDDGSKLAAVVESPGRIYTSTDSGVNWTERGISGNWWQIASSGNGEKLVALNKGLQIYTSTDSGVSWTARATNQHWNSVASSSDGTKLVVTVDGGKIHTSTDSGVTWTEQANSVTANWRSVASSADGNKLVATAWNGKIYTSTDSGVNWTARDSDRAWLYVTSSADGNRLAAVVNNGKIHFSTNSGVTWTASTTGADSAWPIASSADGTKMVTAQQVGKIWTSEGALAAFSVALLEDAGAQSIASVATSIATGDAAQAVSFTVTNTNNALFSAQPAVDASGTLTFTPAANAFGSATVSVVAVDDGGTANGGVNTSAAQTFAVTVTAANDTPTDIALSATTIAENNAANATVGTLSSTDADTSDTFTYTLVAGTGSTDNSSFSISGASLRLTPSANFEAKSSYALRLRTTDAGGLFYEEAFTITILDVNDLPVITSNGGLASASVSVAENSTAVTTVVATDADLPAQGISYSISGTDAAKFSIVPATGVLAFVSAPNFEAATDVGANNVYDLVVTATDDGSPVGTKTQTIAVTVTNVNEAPIITSNGGGATAAVTIAENATAVTTVTSTDVDASSTKTFSISGGADSAKFSIVAGTGVLTFAPAPNYEVPTDADLDNVYEVTVRIVDNGSPVLDDTQALSVTVTDANDAPVITSNGGLASASINVAENTTAVTTVVANDGGDLPTQSITYSISGTDVALFAIDPNSGVLTFRSAPNFESKLDSGANNVYDLVVTATDNGTPAGTKTQTIAVTVTNVNEAPVITSNSGGATAAVTIAENTTAVTTVTATDVDVPSTLTYSISGGADSGKFSINSSSGVLAFSVAPDFDLIQDADANNVFEVIVRVLDNGTTPAAYDDTQAISVTVTNVNETPVITSNGGGATAVFNVVEGTSLATTVVSTDPDVGQVRTYSITGGQDADQFTIDANTGALSFNFTASQGLPKDVGGNNIYLVNVRVSDAGTPALTDSQDMTITVVDDPAVTPAIVIQNMHSDSTSMTRANLVADINPSGNSTSITFEYSTSPTFASGLVLTAGPYNIGSGTSLMEVEAPITGLVATSTYYWRIKATNSFGTVTSGSQQLYKVSVMPSYAQGQAYGKAVAGTTRDVWGKTWGGVAPYTYQFDFGDGTFASGSVTNTDYIQTTKSYSSAGSKNYILKITDANGSVCTRSGVIRVLSVAALADRVHLAMEKGLVYLYRNPTVYDADRLYYTWGSYALTNEHVVGATGFSLLAFEEHDHLPDEDAVEEIYAPLTYRIRNTLLGYATLRNISNHSNGIAVQVSDANANGQGISYIGMTYADSIAAMAVTLSVRNESQAKALNVPYGPLKDLRTMYSFVQDSIDQLLWSMGDGTLRGAYVYSTLSASQSRYDGSAQQWPALAAGAARDRLGISFPQWALTDFAYGFNYLKNAEGGVGYSNSGEWNNLAKTGGALAALSFGGQYAGDNTDATSYRNYIAKYWAAAGNWSAVNAGWFGQWYAMYGLKKGLSLGGITTLTTPSNGTRDWKKDLNGWLLGEAATIDAQTGTIGSGQRTQANMFGQLSNGSWTSSLEPGSLGNSTNADTATAILILSDAVTRAVPVAVIAPISDQTNKPAGMSFRVDGTGSYHLDADSAIAEYLWDWNASDGVNWAAPNASGAMPTNPGYTAIGTYTITLRVKDNKTPSATSIATTTVTVTNLDVAPIAVAKPIGGYDGYAGKVGRPITLTGTDSYDPDGDTIVSYSWDFNGDGIYGGAADLTYGDPTQPVTTVIYSTPYIGSIGLRVTANGKTSSNISYIDIQAGDADLRIDSVTYSNTVRRTTTDVSIVVTNDPASGRAYNNVLLRLYNGDPYAGGGPVGAVQTLNFSAGQTITVNLTNIDLGGAPILWAFLDTNNSVLEYDELNNISGPTRLDPEIDIEQPVGTALTDAGADNNFGTLIIGETSLKTYTITNSGTLNLTGIAATKDGAHSGDFILTQPLASSLAPGASTTFTVTYTPTAADSRTAAVHISSNDFDEAPFNISLTGFARAYPTNITLSTATINENNAANATVGTLTTTDTNVADTHTYTLVAGTGDEDNASFTIAANALKLTPSADYETKITYNLRLRTTDQTGLTFEKAFVVTIVKLNEAPVLAATQLNPTSLESAGVATGTLGVNLFSASAVTDIDDVSASLGGGNIRVTFAEYITGDLIELPTSVTHALNAVQLSGTNVQISNGSAWTTIATRDATNTGIGKALTLTLNASATEDNIRYVIDALIFRSTSDNPTVNQTKLTRTYSLVINDGNNNALAGGPLALDSNTIAGGTLTITPTNDFPVVDLNGATAGVNHAVTWTEVANGTHVTAAITSSATMTDADNVNFSSMNFTLGGILDANSEVVTIGGTVFPLATDATNTVVTGGFKVSYNSTTDVFTIEPNGAAYATLTSFQTLLNGVTYNNLTDNPTDGDRTLTVMVTDAGLNNLAGVGSVSSTLVTTTINVNPVNDQPVIAGLVAPTYFENALNAAAATLDATATVTDIDSLDYNGATLTVSGLVAAQDLVSLPIGAVPALDNVQLTGTNVEINDGSNWVVVGTATGGTGNNFVVTFNASATVRSAELVLERLTFANSSHNPTLTRTLTLTLNDNDGNATQAATLLVTIKLDNDAPDITGTVGLAYTEQGTAAAFVSGATTSDPDQPTNFRPNATYVGNLRVALDGYVTGDLLSVANIGTAAGQIGVSGANVSFAGTTFATTTGGTAADLVITFSSTTATPTAVSALINALRYNSTSDDPTVNNTDTSRVVTVTFNDGANTIDATSSTTALTDTLTGNINLTAVNDLPVIVVTGAASYSENGLALTVDGTTTVTDLDDTQMAGGSVRISTGFLAGDTLAVTAVGDVTGSYDAATGVLTLSGTDTRANYQTVLRSLTYVTASEDPTDNATKLTRVLTYSLTDANSDSVGAATGTTTKTINITPSNDRPVVTAGATLAYAENVAATAIDGTVTVNDADDTQITGATATISAGLTTGDVLAVTTQNGISGTYTAGTGVLALTGTTTLANYQAALRSVTYRSTSEDPTVSAVNRTVTWVVTDANSDSAGAQTSVAVTSTITITPSNDKPVVTAGATLAYTENAAALAIDGTVTVNDVDDTQITGATATISAGLTTGDLLAVATQNGISGIYTPGTGVLALTGTATLAQYQTALRSVTYRSTSEDPTVSAVSRTVTWAVTDANSDLAGAQTSVAVTSTINITPINDKPVVTAGATLAYAENDAATAIDGTVTVNDTDDTQIAGATATISAGLTAGDLLAVATQNGISGSYNAGVLTLTGTASLADYQAALRSVTYQSTSEDPTVTAVNRTVTWVVTDANSDLAGAQASIAVTSTITITPSNDKPVVTAGATLAYTENAAATAIDGTVTVNDA